MKVKNINKYTIIKKYILKLVLIQCYGIYNNQIILYYIDIIIVYINMQDYIINLTHLVVSMNKSFTQIPRFSVPSTSTAKQSTGINKSTIKEDKDIFHDGDNEGTIESSNGMAVIIWNSHNAKWYKGVIIDGNNLGSATSSNGEVQVRSDSSSADAYKWVFISGSNFVSAISSNGSVYIGWNSAYASGYKWVYIGWFAHWVIESSNWPIEIQWDNIGECKAYKSALIWGDNKGHIEVSSWWATILGNSSTVSAYKSIYIWWNSLKDASSGGSIEIQWDAHWNVTADKDIAIGKRAHGVNIKSSNGTLIVWWTFSGNADIYKDIEIWWDVAEWSKLNSSNGSVKCGVSFANIQSYKDVNCEENHNTISSSNWLVSLLKNFGTAYGYNWVSLSVNNGTMSSNKKLEVLSEQISVTREKKWIFFSGNSVTVTGNGNTTIQWISDSKVTIDWNTISSTSKSKWFFDTLLGAMGIKSIWKPKEPTSQSGSVDIVSLTHWTDHYSFDMIKGVVTKNWSAFEWAKIDVTTWTCNMKVWNQTLFVSMDGMKLVAYR